MPSSILSPRARISSDKASRILRCYAERKEPQDTAKAVKLSINTVYLQYRRIRERLIATGYYRDGALSFDEAGLGPGISQKLRQRKRIREESIHPHAAELIHWDEEWPPKLVLKHMRRLIELTGPLDSPHELSDAEFERLQSYVRYARTELIYERAQESAAGEESMIPYRDRAKAALDGEWRAYRTASKKVERERR